MKKVILGVVATIVLATAGSVFAKDNPGGQPFDAIWKAIEGLETKISNIQLIPGPRGEQGLPGKSLKLVDDNGQDLGVVIDVSSNFSSFTTYLPLFNVIAHFDQVPELVQFTSDGQNIHFSEENCMGKPFSPNNWFYQGLGYGGGRYYKWNGESITHLVTLSQMTGNNECFNSSVNLDGFPLEEISAPFVEPLKWPLKVVEK